MCQKLPLFSPYPLQTELIRPEELREFEMVCSLGWPQRPLRKQRTIYTPYEAVCDSIEDGNSEIVRKMEERFVFARASAIAKGIAPDYSRIPLHRDYQNRGLIHGPGMSHELAAHGISLTTGQYVFHGGDTECPMEPFPIRAPFSVSFAASIGVWHARHDAISKWDPKVTRAPVLGKNPTVWILRVSSLLIAKVLLLPGKGEEMGDEMEAVLGPSARIEPWRSSIYEGVTIVEAYLH